MSLAHIVVTLPAAAMAGYSGIVVLTRAWGSPLWGRIVKALTDHRVPRSWWNRLGAAKTAGAVVTVARARRYAHLPYPMVHAAPVIAALAPA